MWYSVIPVSRNQRTVSCSLLENSAVRWRRPPAARGMASLIGTPSVHQRPEVWPRLSVLHQSTSGPRYGLAYRYSISPPAARGMASLIGTPSVHQRPEVWPRLSVLHQSTSGPRYGLAYRYSISPPAANKQKFIGVLAGLASIQLAVRCWQPSKDRPSCSWSASG